MKADKIIDACIEYSGKPVVVELPNGVQMVTTDYSHGYNKKGEPVLIIHAGRKLT